MICPNCKKSMEDTGLDIGGKKVFKFFVVGADVQSGKTYCSLCVNKRAEKIAGKSKRKTKK